MDPATLIAVFLSAALFSFLFMVCIGLLKWFADKIGF